MALGPQGQFVCHALRLAGWMAACLEQPVMGNDVPYLLELINCERGDRSSRANHGVPAAGKGQLTIPTEFEVA